MVTVMNWGLGHATRTMPIINQLLEWKAEIILAGDGRSLHLLCSEYPHLESVELPSYNVRYTSGAAMVGMTLIMVPAYLRAIYQEHKLLEQLIEDRGIEMVISDNRYGMWSSNIPSVFICHQISVIPPDIIRWTMPLIHKLHLQFMHRFDEIWIPDLAENPGLSGILSHNYHPTAKMKFIGPMSRFQEIISQQSEEASSNVLVVLSGPEPQRTILEQKIAGQARSINRKFVIVQGKTERFEQYTEGNITYISFMNAQQLASAFGQADVVIARSGYSTVMDLYSIGKKAVFIPTPGQTEQIYLARQLARRDMAVVQDQKYLDLANALEKVRDIAGFPVMERNDLYKEILKDFIDRQLVAPTRN